MSPRPATAASARTLRIWDLPTRLFHWLLAACVIGAIATAQIGGLWMDWHVRLGIATLFLLLFRIVWGFVGPYHARFVNFVRGPAAIHAYLRGKLPAAGHSPLAALSVLAMLLAILVQVITGLFATDGIFIEGPLASSVSSATSDTLTGIHQVNRYFVIGLIALHLFALAWYSLVRRQSLVLAMVSGNKLQRTLPERSPDSEDGWQMRVRALIVALLVAGLMWWLLPLRW